MHWGSKLHGEELHAAELGISTLCSLFLNANRDPKKGEPAKPADFFYFKPEIEEEKDKLPDSCCNAFFSLIADSKLPQWALSLAPLDKLRAGKTDDMPPRPRALMRKGLLLLAPRFSAFKVNCSLAIVDEVEGRCAAIDVDSGMVHSIFVPNKERNSYWVKDAEFTLEGIKNE